MFFFKIDISLMISRYMRSIDTSSFYCDNLRGLKRYFDSMSVKFVLYLYYFIYLLMNLIFGVENSETNDELFLIVLNGNILIFLIRVHDNRCWI